MMRLDPAPEKTKSDLMMILGRGLAAGFVLAGVLFYGTYGFLYRGWVAFTNGVLLRNVTVTSKPHDCEWDTAPLGSKHCHYDSHEMRFDVNGNPAQAGNNGSTDKIVVVWEKVSE